MKPHRSRGLVSPRAPSTASSSLPPVDLTRGKLVGVTAASAREGVEAAEAIKTLHQLEKVVSEFAITYPSHTQRIPAVLGGEQPLIAFVRTMVASMAAKQEELERLNEEVLEAAAEKERFLASMSHEVRTPMNGIFGMVNLLLEMDIDDKQREYLETIQSSSESLLNILDDILDYAKLNSGEFQLRPRAFDLARIVREALSVYKPTADKKALELGATVCSSLPDRLVADDLRLKQVICNLVSNAIKFTDRGRVHVTVARMRKSSRDQLLFQVEDTGIGIRREAAKHLFSPFHQIESTGERRFEGTGLGLAISKNLVEAMGGRVWFESEEGKGTSFLFTIDFESAEEESAEEDLVHRCEITPAGPSERNDQRLRVLLVEDNKVNQKVAVLTLQQLGCEVTVASNGQEAVDLADGPIHFDLVCMDVNMPVMNGLEAAAAIRELDHRNSTVPILAMTGMAFDEDRERCLAAGMDGVVTKPFAIDDLRSRIASVVGNGEHAGAEVELPA